MIDAIRNAILYGGDQAIALLLSRQPVTSNVKDSTLTIGWLQRE